MRDGVDDERRFVREQAERDACKTEHLFSRETTNKMVEFAKSYKNIKL